jgi:hypothetical protein
MSALMPGLRWPSLFGQNLLNNNVMASSNWQMTSQVTISLVPHNNVPYPQFFHSSYLLEGIMFNIIQAELGSVFIGFSFINHLIQLATNSSLFSFVGFTISLWRVFF